MEIFRGFLTAIYREAFFAFAMAVLLYTVFAAYKRFLYDMWSKRRDSEEEQRRATLDINTPLDPFWWKVAGRQTQVCYLPIGAWFKLVNPTTDTEARQIYVVMSGGGFDLVKRQVSGQAYAAAFVLENGKPTQWRNGSRVVSDGYFSIERLVETIASPDELTT